MDNDKKLDEILNNTRHSRMMLETVMAFVNSCAIILLIGIGIKWLARK